MGERVTVPQNGDDDRPLLDSTKQLIAEFEKRHWLTTEDLARRLQTSPGTVRYWRHIGYGPPGTRFRRRVLYDATVVAQWEQDQIDAGMADGA